jgi:hypothetical protein
VIRRGLAALLTLAALAAVRAQQPPPAMRPYERGVKTSAAGPQKLRIDVPLLTGGQRFDRITPDGDGSQAQGGLDDLRLFDASGRELGYLLISPRRRRASWNPGAVLAVAQTEKTSGFEVDLGQTREVDALAIDGLPPPFLKRFVLEGSGDRSRWTMLISQGTLFDLPAERVRQTYAAFESGPYRYLRLTWDDTNSARLPLPRGVRAREALVEAATEPLRSAVTAQKQASEPGRSRYRIQLPSAGLPVVALTLDIGAGDVFRTATIMEMQFNGARADPVEVGRARLVRMQQGGSAQTSLRIPIQAPRGAELQLVVDDGNNPPLSIDGVGLEFAELPWIYFEAPAGTITARYGNAAATAPQYDLEARRAFVNLESVPEAAWDEPHAVAGAEPPAPPPPTLPDRGAAIDVNGFRVRRPLPEGPSGLVALQLDAAVLSHSRGPGQGFRDVRVVDEQGNQVPYLVERRPEPLSLDLSLKPATPQIRSLGEGTQGNRSIYAITLPYPNLPDPRLVFETSDRVFRRTLQIGIERPPDRRRRDTWFDVLASPGWQHADQSTAAPPLEIPLGADDRTELLLIVDEGDNRPLPITAVRLLLPSWRLRFFRPAAPLRLIYGKDEAVAPEYDLALLAPAVMGSEARDLSAEAEPTAASTPPAVLSPRLFWIGLGLAVAVLLGLIVRLISSATEPPPSPPAP